MNYLRPIANRIRDRVPRQMLPDGDATLLFDLYAALALSRGTQTNERDVHDAWVIWMISKAEDHPAMVPYERLERARQREDRPYVEAIREVARSISRNSEPRADESPEVGRETPEG
jgi:hypothetical protein